MSYTKYKEAISEVYVLLWSATLRQPLSSCILT